MSKRFHYDWKTGRMKDTQSNSQATKDMRVLETIINDACYSYEKKLNEQEETIQNQKMEINLLLEEMKEIRDKLTIYLEIRGDVE